MRPQPRHPDRTRTGRAIRALALAGVLAAALGTAGCSELISRAMPSGVIQPSISPSSTERGSLPAEREFGFEGGTVRLSVPIDQAVYGGASGARKSAIFIGSEKPANWVPDYYRAFVSEKHQDAFYASTLQALRTIRQEQGLDESRYAELITSMAQTLSYNTDPGSLAPKFPIETYADGYGDCDDKTLLAAALLAREGYDVSVLLFEPEKHVALGIRAPGLDYKGTGYAYVEMTRPSLVGVPAKDLVGGIQLTSQPVVIKVGEGTKSFDAGAQIEEIQKRLENIATETKRLLKQIDAKQSAMDAEKTSLEDARRSLKTTGDPAALELAIERFNARVSAYNSGIAEANRLAERYNALIAAERFAAEHQTARPQVFERLRAAGL